MAKRGRVYLTPQLLKDIKDRVRRTGLVESLYEQKPTLIGRESYNRLRAEEPLFLKALDDAVADYRRAQPDYFVQLAKDCLEDALLSHKRPKITTSKTVKTRYIPNKRNPAELVMEFTEETETTTEVYHRCPPRILEMIMPQVPKTTIDILATQMANEGILPQKKAEAIVAIADQAQTNIRGVLSGGISETEE